jgi:uncharacterized membrane protein
VKVKLGNGLIILDIIAFFLILAIHLISSNVPRIILGVPFLLFIPGYALLVAIFTKKEGMDGIARVAFSFILSLTIVGFFGIILSYTPWGIRLEPILFSIFTFVLITSIITWWRQRKLPKEERFSIELDIKVPSLGQSIWDKMLAVILVIAILGAVGVVAYTSTKPKVKEAFTEFYILGKEGKATNYLTDLKIGVKSSLKVGIINHEGKEVNYRVEASINGTKLSEVGPITLVDGQKSETEIGITPVKAGQNQKLELLLYKGNETKPYLQPIFFWVDVR